MSFAEGRRPATPPPRIVGRSPIDYARELQEFLERLFFFTADGIPPGFKNVTPTELTADGSADAGSETLGWAAADHVHSVMTGEPAHPTGKTADEGTGSAFMRADATIAQGIVTTRGDILTHDGATAERLPVGLDTRFLVADSSAATGLRWADMGEFLDAMRTFFPHPPRIPQVQAGAGVTLTQNALGPVVAATVTSVDSDQLILATQVFGG